MIITGYLPSGERHQRQPKKPMAIGTKGELANLNTWGSIGEYLVSSFYLESFR
jgi:hypothetical protein